MREAVRGGPPVEEVRAVSLEQDWNRLLRSPSEEAFRPVYEATKGLVWTLCLRVLRDPADASDAFQSAYCRLLESARDPAAAPGDPGRPRPAPRSARRTDCGSGGTGGGRASGPRRSRTPWRTGGSVPRRPSRARRCGRRWRRSSRGCRRRTGCPSSSTSSTASRRGTWPGRSDAPWPRSRTASARGCGVSARCSAGRASGTRRRRWGRWRSDRRCSSRRSRRRACGRAPPPP